MKIFKTVFATIAALTIAIAAPAMASGDDFEVRKLAIQISDNDPKTMTKVLNVAANFARGASEAGYEYQIEIVAFNAGLHLLREDTSPVLERVNGFPSSLPDVHFSACGNTINGMTKKEGKAPPIISAANVVPAGVVRLMELDAEGYFVVRP